MSKPKVLVQLDSDPQPSVFDTIVAIDAGVDHVLRYCRVTPESVRDLVYGAMFTRGPQDLASSAIFIGGSDLEAGERLLEQVAQCFFSSVRVSLMIDSGGANTTAAAAVLAAEKHVELTGTTALVLAATGPVGRRVVRLLARQGSVVRVASRSLDRARDVCDQVAGRVPQARLEPYAVSEAGDLARALAGATLVISAGPPATLLLSQAERQRSAALKLAIDLNAVPPLGIEGVQVTDKGTQRDEVVSYGAIGVGGTKMKIHKAAIARLFSANDLVLDAEAIFEIAREL